MSNALHDYAKLFEKYAANNGGTGAILAGEDCLSLANEMRMDADAIDAENARLRGVVASLADRSFRMADKMNLLQSENAKLREEVVELRKSSQTYDAENAKLRELVQEMWANQEALPYGLHIEIRDRMRELGVEVDG